MQELRSAICLYYLQECAVHISYFLYCCFSCRHVAKETFSREVLQNENSNEFSRQSLRKCVRIFARTLRSAHFRSLRGPSARTPRPDLTKFPTTIHFVFPASFASKVGKVVRSFALHGPLDIIASASNYAHCEQKHIAISNLDFTKNFKVLGN